MFWQIMPAKKFDAEEMSSFFDLLPPTADGRPLRHAVEVRHESFQCPEFVELARAAGVAVAYVDSVKHAPIADPTADFVYARLERTRAEEPTGYPKAEIEGWAERARVWRSGGAPKDLPLLTQASHESPRDVFVYFISGAKERAPVAAAALIETLGA